MVLNPTIIEHWHCQYEDVQLSTREFYIALSDALKEKQFPKVQHYTIDMQEAGLLSGSRDYFIVSRPGYQFVICAAPFGANFFFSWYVKENNPAFLLLYVPFIGSWLYKLASSKTYFQNDTIIMFKESVKQVVKGVLAQIEQDKGLRAISTHNTAVLA